MAAKKRGRRARRPAARAGIRRLATSWNQTRDALDKGRVTLEKRARALLETSGLDSGKAAERIEALRHQLGLERRRAVRQIEGRLVGLRARADRERRAIGHKLDAAVRRALVALDMPSRKELQVLTRRVEELSRRIDALRRRQPAAPTKSAPGKAPRKKAVARR